MVLGARPPGVTAGFSLDPIVVPNENQPPKCERRDLAGAMQECDVRFRLEANQSERNGHEHPMYSEQGLEESQCVPLEEVFLAEGTTDTASVLQSRNCILTVTRVGDPTVL